MIDLANPEHRQRLWASMARAWEGLEPHRNQRRELLDMFCGSNAIRNRRAASTNPTGRSNRDPVANLLAMVVEAHVTSLVAQNPRVNVTTYTGELKPFAAEFAATINKLLERIGFEQTMKQIVTDAFFGISIAKTCYRPAWDEDHSTGYENTAAVEASAPDVMRVSLEDFGFDIKSRTLDDCRFMWHEYDVPFDELASDPRIDPEALKKLPRDAMWQTTLFSNASLVTDDMAFIEPMVRVADLYLPREKIWAIVASDMNVLYAAPWTGQSAGPFRMLCMDEVPDSLIPKAPGQDSAYLHRLYNALMRKIAKQAMSQKTVNGYVGNSEDASKIKRADDGEFVRVTNPAITPVRIGGVDNNVLGFTQLVEGTHSRSVGNLDARQGLGPQAKTATQETFIQQALTRKEEHYRGRVMGLVGDVVKDLACLAWKDQYLTIESELAIPGVQQPLITTWTPEYREGSLNNYDVLVEPYSMGQRTPRSRADDLIGLMQNVFIPLMPAFQASGANVDWMALTEELADLYDEPRIRRIINFYVPPPQEMMPPGGQGQGEGSRGGSGPKEYIHRNVNQGASPEQEREQQIQSLMTAGTGDGA